MGMDDAERWWVKGGGNADDTTIAMPGCHPRFAQGMGQRANDWLVIPLCPHHHQDGGVGAAIHASQLCFEGNHGKETDLLAKVIQLMVK